MLDTDGDGLTDGIEVQFGTDPAGAWTRAPVPAPRSGRHRAAVITAAGHVPAQRRWPPPAVPTAPGGGSGSVQHMIDLAMAQVGDDYVFGADVAETDPDPSVWDCAEFTQWSASPGRAPTSRAARSSSTST